MAFFHRPYLNNIQMKLVMTIICATFSNDCTAININNNGKSFDRSSRVDCEITLFNIC